MATDLVKQREYRQRTHNAATTRYERTKQGKLMRCYRNMKSRIEGVQYLKAHLYLGKYLLPKHEFYEWALADREFHRLYAEWVESGYQMAKAPSVDRIDSSTGYELGNMQWVTHSENSRRAGRWTPRKRDMRPIVIRHSPVWGANA